MLVFCHQNSSCLFSVNFDFSVLMVLSVQQFLSCSLNLNLAAIVVFFFREWSLLHHLPVVFSFYYGMVNSNALSPPHHRQSVSSLLHLLPCFPSSMKFLGLVGVGWCSVQGCQRLSPCLICVRDHISKFVSLAGLSKPKCSQPFHLHWWLLRADWSQSLGKPLRKTVCKTCHYAGINIDRLIPEKDTHIIDLFLDTNVCEDVITQF